LYHFHLSGLERCSLPHSRSYWTELGYQSLVCLLFSFLLSYACGLELFTLILRLDLGVVTIVVDCDCFDCGYYFPLLHTSLIILAYNNFVMMNLSNFISD